ncbi:hypothetical protein WLH_05541 [Escherichia coli O25b:H4]|uniref:Uncharacterized protein n=1 Tax=Escherichia coli O25b:H4 TaxID=941280 RepID=A0A192CM48_ECO25|nr:hypothetical protein WLH_05541 [Escherichia coli O25b:H4]
MHQRHQNHWQALQFYNNENAVVAAVIRRSTAI